MTLSNERYERGRERLAEVDGSTGEAIGDSLGDLGPCHLTPRA